MKNLATILFTVFISSSLLAQPGKEKNKDKSKPEVVDIKVNQPNDHDKKVWEGVYGSADCGKASKNQPAKVRSSFARDYPNATGVRWTKCRGDWTATFTGIGFTSTAVYHANGQRKDTRTPVEKNSLPRVILDDIIKKRPGINIGNIIRIDLPVTNDPIFRVKVGDTTPEYIYYKPTGAVVNYSY